MQVQVGSTQLSNLSSDLLVVGVYGKGGRRSEAWKVLNRALGGGLESLLEVQGWQGKPGDVITFPAPGRLRCKLVMVGSLGDRGSVGPGPLRELANSAGSAAVKSKLGRIAFFLDPALDKRGELDRPSVQALGEGLAFGAYSFDRYRTNKKPEDARGPTDIYLYFEGRRDRPLLATALERGTIIGSAQNRARDLVNEPANSITPDALVEYARALSADLGMEFKTLDEEACAQRKMGAFLAVGQGSDMKSTLAHMIWKPAGGADKRIVLVGKALTYDSGGMCLKPASGQATMKMDMGGSAAVIGAMAAVAELQLPIEVHGIFAATENMTGASAYHTGDVLTASNGKTIEVLNTDAEGRLTLADALVYACEQKPDMLVDLATLTGACMVALGPTVGGIMGTGRGVIRGLRSAGERSGEALWELPMPTEYRELLNSKIADMTNLGGRFGGAITAGIFLKEFVDEDVPWAHIDIAGPAFMDKPMGGRPYGATGYPVRALVEWISMN